MSVKYTDFHPIDIDLPEFNFDHKPYTKDSNYRDFFGRDEEVDLFVDMLNRSNSNSGSYLVTGYRGAGKTSFVRKVLQHFSDGYRKDSSLDKSLNKIGRHIPKDIALIIAPILTNTLYLLYLLYLLISPFYLVIDIIFFSLIIIYLHHKKYGDYSISRLMECFVYSINNIFKPVVVVNINLGYDIKNVKEVIFNVSSSLRERYKETLNARPIFTKIIIPLFIFIISIFLVDMFMSVFNVFHNHTKNKIEHIIFSQPEPEHKQRSSSAKKDDHSETKGENIKINLSTECKKDNVSTKEMWPEIKHGKEHFNIKGSLYTGAIERNIYNTSEEFPIIREYILKPVYCSVYHIASDILFFVKDEKKGWDKIYLDDRSRFLVSAFKDISDLSYNLFYHPKNKTRETDDYLDPYKIIILFFSFLFFQSTISFLMKSSRHTLHQLNNLQKRIEAADVLDAGISNMPFFSRRHRHFEKLEAPEAESLLLSILEQNSYNGWNWLCRPRIVFVFDELDKIKPPKERVKQGVIEPIELGFSESVRQRKFEIEELLGSLKNLITAAPCHFIFIAGREMMDANLADRSEIRFLHSSLFEYVFYIPSFLTDSSDKNEYDISSMVEQYVCRRLMTKEKAEEAYDKIKKTNNSYSSNNTGYSYFSLAVYHQYLEIEASSNSLFQKIKNIFNRVLINIYSIPNTSKKPEDIHKKIIFIQDFIYFLTYRSGGNPKKMALYFEEFIKSSKYNKDKNKKELFLSFDEKNQYRIQLISYFFIMFHGSYSKIIRNYGDKLSVSVFFILDYIYKFHSMAFSRRDLEHMHAALDIHRAPALPEITDLIVEKIMSPYIQKINNGVFRFRFSFYIQREIIYISQFSEQDMAAFNFSLDESIQVKQHYRQLLSEQLKLIDRRNTADDANKRSTYVLSDIHNVLGDLHAHDNEMDQTVIEYRYAIYYLDAIIDGYFKESESDNDDIGTHVVLYLKTMLKLGLVQEKRKIYNEAFTAYYRAIKIIIKVLKSQDGKDFFISNIEQLSLFQQPFLSLSYLHAKLDKSSSSSQHFINEWIEILDGFLGEEKKHNDFKSSIYLSKGNFYIQCSHLWIMRSEYKKSIDAIKKSSESLAKLPEESEHKNYNNIANIFIGMADSFSGVFLHQLYSTKEDANLYTPENIAGGKTMFVFNSKSSTEVDDLFQKIENFGISDGKDEDKHYSKDNDLLKDIIILYTMASKSYFLSGDYLNQGLSLFKLVYFLVIGLSYSEKNSNLTIPKNNIDKNTYKDYTASLFSDFKDVEPKNILRGIFSQVFEGSYSMHRRSLETNLGNPGNPGNEGNINEKVWISPPLCQMFIVLSAYWEDEMDSFEIADVGAFPMHTRIMALFLKGRDKVDKEKYEDAFIFLVKAIEAAQSFESGVELLAPPIGIMYFHLWDLLVNKFSVPKERDKLKENEYLSGDKARYLIDFDCAIKAKTLLSVIQGRHNEKGISIDSYRSYMSNKYYLYDDFSDSYVQTLWTIEYGLTPLIQSMLDKIDKHN